jgi:hypothetical protein
MRARLLLVALLVLLLPAAAGAAERRVQDPGSGPVWTATASDTPGGRTCVVVRQGDAQRSRYCDRLGRGTPFAYNVGFETPPERENWRTVVAITFSRDVVSATLDTPDGVRRYRRGVGPRVLLAVIAGKVDEPPLEVRVRAADGSVLVSRGGGDPGAEVPDPLGGPAWRTVVESRSSTRSCVSWKRVAPRFGGPPGRPAAGRLRCGNPSASIAAAGIDRAGGRVVVTGLVGPAVRSVALRGPGNPPLTFDRTSRSVLAVLPERTETTGLVLRATLRDGRIVERPLG